METHEEKLEKHAFQQMRVDIFNTFDSLEKSDMDAEKKHPLFRVRNIIQFLSDAYDNSIKELVTYNLMDYMNTKMATVQQKILDYKTTLEKSHLETLEATLSEILRRIPEFQMLNNKHREKTLESIYNDTFKKVNEQTKLYVEKTEGIIKIINENQDKVNTVLTENKKNAKDNLEELSKSITNEKTRIDAFIQEGQAKTANMANELSTLKNETKNTVDSQLLILNQEQKKYELELQDLKTKNEKDNLELINQYKVLFDNKVEEFKNIVNLVSDSGQTHCYRENADKEKKSKTIWRVGTIISIVILMLFTAYFFAFTKIEDSAFTLITKFLATTSIASLAVYTMKQASKAEKNEKIYRTKELDLTTLNHYLDGLPNAAKIKEELAYKFYGQIDEMNSLDDSLPIIEIAKILAEQIKVNGKTDTVEKIKTFFNLKKTDKNDL